MTPPLVYDSTAPGLVCKLNQSLYSLKQASYQWNKELPVKLSKENKTN